MNHFKNYKPSKVSRNFIDQLAKIFSFSPSKTRRENQAKKELFQMIYFKGFYDDLS